MFDLNCLWLYEFCLYILVKWFYKLIIEILNVYVIKYRKLIL